MTDTSEQPTWTVFATIIAVIIAGTSGWVFLTMFTARATAPDEAKDLAKEFEKVCYEKIEKVETCKELTGQHHRHCLNDARVRKPSEAKEDQKQYSQDQYIECMTDSADLDGESGVGSGE